MESEYVIRILIIDEKGGQKKLKEDEKVSLGNYFLIQYDVIKQINRYTLLHEPKGGFLTAVLSNNLREAIWRSDPVNFHALRQIVNYCHNEIPGMCWGSPQRILEWLQMPPEKWLSVVTAPETQKEMDRQVEEKIWCFKDFKEERKNEIHRKYR